MKRSELAELIVLKLNKQASELEMNFKESNEKIGYFYIDDLLPENIVNEIYNIFPDPKNMTLNKTLREYKYIAAQMNQYNPLLEEVIYAFQAPIVVECISRITGVDNLFPDDNLYAGGLSLMGDGHYLNPHLDNSHDKDRDLWRVFNLLYYVSPNWNDRKGGSLELWPDGVKKEQITVESRCNRLVVMATNQNSWHSVSPILVDETRCCVSNYYFSPDPLIPDDEFHVTTFRARPGQTIRDMILLCDGTFRGLIRKLVSKGIKKTTHVYKKD
jgi:Rps23 Pro-64 3,4-dihydroxylase Tpa1-like proline 4-hydroxylase